MDSIDFWKDKLGSLPDWEDEGSETVLKLKALYREFASLAVEVSGKTFTNEIELLDFEAVLGKAELMRLTVKTGKKGKYEENLTKELEAIENIVITVGGLKTIFEEGRKVDPPWSLAVLAQVAFIEFMSSYKNVGAETD